MSRYDAANARSFADLGRPREFPVNSDINPALAAEDFCYLTTTGRVSGKPHTIELWFALEGRTVYMLHGAGRASDSVRNAMRQPEVTLRIGGRTWAARARIVEPGEEDALARRLLLAKYAAGSENDLSDWGREALPLAVDLGGDEPAEA